MKREDKSLALQYAQTCGPGDPLKFSLCNWIADEDVVLTLLRRNIEAFIRADSSLKAIPEVVEHAFLLPEHIKEEDFRLAASDKHAIWRDPVFVHQLIEKHLHNPDCDMTDFLSLGVVKHDLDLIDRIIPRCNFHTERTYALDSVNRENIPQDAYELIMSNKQSVLRLVQYHPYVLDFDEEDEEDEDRWYIPTMMKDDPDLQELARAVKRRRVAEQSA